MAKNVGPIEDSDVEMDETRQQNEEDLEEKGTQEENEEGGEDDEEYEVEAVLHHKYNMPQFEGRIGYFVKWKGYPDSDNSYIDEMNADGAKDLIEAYWKKQKKAQGPKPKGRRPSARDASEEVEPTPPPPKKRGRPPKKKTPEPEIISGEDEEETAPKTKKTKTAQPRVSGAAAGKRRQRTPESEEEGENLGTMEEWMDAPSWEHLVESIDTVERTKDNELFVYFTLNNKKAKKAGFQRCRVASEICKKKMPGKLLDFYESNLRWREDNGEDS